MEAETPKAQSLPLRAIDNGSLPPSPVLAFVGRKNSGKTTLLVKLIAELTARNVDVATLKHHGHPHFEIDIPGKDSYRHRQAGAKASAVLSDQTFALIQDLPFPATFGEAFPYLYGHDIVLVEGFRNEGIPTVEIMRQASPRDCDYVPSFAEAVRTLPATDLRRPIAAVSDIPQVQQICQETGLPCFDPDIVAPLADFVQERFCRAQLGVVIQAGGESKRMGQSKALVPFRGEPLIAHMVRRLNPIATDLLITTNEPEKLQFLTTEFPNVRFASDESDTRGALPGMITALRNTRCAFVAPIACDMVNVSPRLIALELAMLQATGSQGVVPQTKHGYEPLSGVYKTAPFLAAAEELEEEGGTRLRGVLEKLDLTVLTRDNPYGIHFPLGCFMNVNTPEELAFAEKLLCS
ncbi:MAG: molybdopterin-guanine dinucleotide biosynthesis protein B [Eggerthellales bacterium]|nr:molybdopterin-guanine dinucleotide biosynthesis protein B [Eggerthellales bacterium]